MMRQAGDKILGVARGAFDSPMDTTAADAQTVLRGGTPHPVLNGAPMPGMPAAQSFWGTHGTLLNVLKTFRTQSLEGLEALGVAYGAAANLYDHTDNVSAQDIRSGAFADKPTGMLERDWRKRQEYQRSLEYDRERREQEQQAGKR
jgi:hypothetical protein